MLYNGVVSEKLIDLLIELQSEPIFKDYILGGGTALALQIGHRKSIDIDLFTTKKQNNNNLLEYFNFKYKYFDLISIDTYILRLVVNKISIDLIGTNQNILEIPKTENGITLFGLRDIAAMKLRAVSLRREVKDFIDIAYLLKTIPMDSMFDLYKKKYGTDDILFAKKSLSECFHGIDKNELHSIEMLKNDIDLEDVPKIISNALFKYNDKNGIKEKPSFFNYFKPKRNR